MTNETRQMDRDEMIEAIRSEGYQPIHGPIKVLFLDYKEGPGELPRVVGELPNDSERIVIRYQDIIHNDPNLSRKELLAQNEFYISCKSIGLSPQETYAGSRAELEALHGIFSRLMEERK